MAVTQDSPLFAKNSLNSMLMAGVQPRFAATPVQQQPAQQIQQDAQQPPVQAQSAQKATATPAEKEQSYTVQASAPTDIGESPAIPTVTPRPTRPESDPWKAFGSPAMALA